MATPISYFIVDRNEEKLIRLKGEKIKEKIQVKNKNNNKNPIIFIFLVDFLNIKNKEKRIGKIKISAEILVAKPTPEIKEAKNKCLNLNLLKIFSDKKILTKKTKTRIDSVVPK